MICYTARLLGGKTKNQILIGGPKLLLYCQKNKLWNQLLGLQPLYHNVTHLTLGVPSGQIMHALNLVQESTSVATFNKIKNQRKQALTVISQSLFNHLSNCHLMNVGMEIIKRVKSKYHSLGTLLPSLLPDSIFLAMYLDAAGFPNS